MGGVNHSHHPLEKRMDEFEKSLDDVFKKMIEFSARIIKLESKTNSQKSVPVSASSSIHSSSSENERLAMHFIDAMDNRYATKNTFDSYRRERDRLFRQFLSNKINSSIKVNQPYSSAMYEEVLRMFDLVYAFRVKSE
jgi:hypothetical protein